MFTPIAGRAVVVTGGSRGIGKGVASVFARNGANVLITGRDAEVAQAAADELPALTASGHGRVIITSSITGPITGYPGWTHYGASKAGQLGFMRTAAIELAPKGITVNAVLPGNIVTEGLAEMGEDYAAGMTAAIPMRRLGTVDEIGYAALFLATDEAAYISGQTIVVDGGQILPESPDAMAVMETDTA